MPDGTYQPKTYRKQGGDEFVIASGGAMTNEAGGAIANKGTITNSSGGVIRDSITDPALSATLPNYGISSVGSSSGTTSYKLGAPVAGAITSIVGATAVGGAVTVTSTAATIGSTQDTITIAEKGGAIQLVGLNTSAWRIVGLSTGASVA